MKSLVSRGDAHGVGSKIFKDQWLSIQSENTTRAVSRFTMHVLGVIPHRPFCFQA
jgi:hypothetical protein